jgi:segregation and condensation protein A
VSQPAHADAPRPEHPAGGQGGPETWSLDSLPPELEYFRRSEAYQVELSGFQGPMDLLLHLIEKDQVDIYDIPIARITDQFIRHIEVMQTVSLEKAGEFIAMAATLMVIKMKMLMPSHRDDDETEEEDPRAELVRRLLEYKRFKEAAESLQKAEEERRRFHLRKTRYPFADTLDLAPELHIGTYELLSALAGIFDRLQADPVHGVEREPFTVEEKMSLIEERVGGGGTCTFEELFNDDSIRMEVVVTFIAILELVKRGRVRFMQSEPRGPIWLQRPGVAEDPAADDQPAWLLADELHPPSETDGGQTDHGTDDETAAADDAADGREAQA